MCLPSTPTASTASRSCTPPSSLWQVPHLLTRAHARTRTHTQAPEWTGGRVIVFFLGGVTYSELRAAHQVVEETGHEIIVGKSSHAARRRVHADTRTALPVLEWWLRLAVVVEVAARGNTEVCARQGVRSELP